MLKYYYVNTDEEYFINNTIKYFRKIRYNRYILFDNLFIKISVPKLNNNVVSTNDSETQK